MFEEIALITVGLAGLWIGSDVVVEAAKNIARRVGISELIIGLTITSIGTSLPEISTNLAAGFSTAAGKDASGIAVGNIIGSELSQITIILGIVGFIATLTTTQKSLRRDGIMMIMAMLLMYMACVDGYVSQDEGVVLVMIYITYLGLLCIQEKVVGKIKQSKESKKNMLWEAAKILVGAGIVIYAADIIIYNGIQLAEEMNISESLIGLFVGLGTSLPELSVSIKAVMRHAGNLSLGNLMGSNITDPLLSFGLGASVGGVWVSQTVLEFDFVYWGMATLIALLLLFNHLNLNRKESSILILLYIFFMYFRITFFP